MRFSTRFVKRVWLLPALIVLGLIFWTAAYMLWGAATYGTLSDMTGRVLKVDANSPAEHGGLQVGDVLLSLNDTPPVMWDGYRHPLYRAGAVSTLTFQRGDRVYTTTIPAELTPANRWLAQLMILLVALAFCLLSLVVLMSRSETVETRQFYVMCQMWAAVLAVGALSSVGVQVASRWLGALNGLLPPAMIHFHALFPERHRLIKNRWSAAALYVIGGVLAVLFWLHPSFSFQPIEMTQTVMYAWLLLGLAAAIGLMIAAYVTTSSPYARRRVRLILFGTVLGFAPFGLLTVAPIALSGRAAWDSWMITIPLMSALPIAYAVALWRYNLMGFDRALNRGLVYLVVSVLLFGAYFVALMFFYTLLPVNRVESAALGAMAALLAAITFRPLRNWIQRVVDRFFYSGWYDYRGLTGEVGRALARTLESDALAEVLVRQVPQAMHLPGAALWLRREEEMEFVARSGIEMAQAQAWVQKDEAVGRGETRMTHAHALVPLLVKDHVIGIWGLAARASEEWGPEDEGILTALGRHAALAAQNVRLVAALRDQVAEVEKMHRRLLAAREDERADLARELHDGVIQDLIGLRYQLDALQEEGGAQVRQVGEIYAQAGLLVDELRRLCSDLRPPALDQLGLAAAVRALVREVTERGLCVEANLQEMSLPDGVAIGLYRIGREALFNVWRHAEASRVIISLTRERDEVVLMVADDGCGFVPASSWRHNGCFGLLGMSERAETLGGHLSVESAPGEGTQVTVRCNLYGWSL